MRQLSIPEAAKQLGVSQDTIRRRIRRGQVQAVQHPTPQGHVWLVEIPDTPDDPRPALDVELLRREAEHWREVAGILHEELVARRREVHELLLLLEQSRRQQGPGSLDTQPPMHGAHGLAESSTGSLR